MRLPGPMGGHHPSSSIDRSSKKTSPHNRKMVMETSKMLRDEGINKGPGVKHEDQAPMAISYGKLI